MAYAFFDKPAIHRIPGIKELAQVGSVPPLVIATAQLLQVLDDSSVNIALPRSQVAGGRAVSRTGSSMAPLATAFP